MSDREQILKTLRAIPGVKWTRGYFITRFWSGDRTSSVIVHDNGEIVRQPETCTLEEAVAALTPPAESGPLETPSYHPMTPGYPPAPPTYEFVAGIKGAMIRGERGVEFATPANSLVTFYFSENKSGVVISAYIADERLTTPTTNPEVLATLKVCRVEVNDV